MKDYKDPHEHNFAFVAEIENADEPHEGIETYPVFAKNIGNAANKAMKFADSKTGGTYYVMAIKITESTNHVIY